MTKKKILLAYSGGLDTSVILKWLGDRYRAEVVAWLADLGQREDLESYRRKALALGAADAKVADLREAFVRDYVFEALKADVYYEGDYLLGTAIARPLIAKAMVDDARKLGCDALAHGATGLGNDQLRFEFAFAALAPELEVIAPWRIWDLRSREKLLEYARRHRIEVPKDKLGEAPFSVDANLLHVSAEGKILEDPGKPAPDHVYTVSEDPRKVTLPPRDLTITFKKGVPTKLDRVEVGPADLLERLNEYGRRYGIGRIDMVETRSTGAKSRGIYETPGGTILWHAHRAVEHLTMDGEALKLKNELMPRYAGLIYDGLWFSPERRMLGALIDESQETVSGSATVELAPGRVSTKARKSAFSRYDAHAVTFEEGSSHTDATGYIAVKSHRLRVDGRIRAKLGAK